MNAPTRPASRPSTSYFPANHPFASYYTPPHRNISPTTSLITVSTSCPSSPTASTTTSRSSRTHSSLSTPLSPSPKAMNTLGHPNLARRPEFTALLAELGLFDTHPRHTLLADLEYILGKKLHFPVISKSKRNEENKVEKKRLRKERSYSPEEDFARETTELIEEKQKERGRGKYRGVREGNWV